VVTCSRLLVTVGDPYLWHADGTSVVDAEPLILVLLRADERLLDLTGLLDAHLLTELPLCSG